MLFVFLTAVITCPGTDVSNGALVPSGPVPVNQTATVQCDVGYKLTGSPTVKCVLDAGQTTATWNDTFSSCQSKCACSLECEHAIMFVVQVCACMHACVYIVCLCICNHICRYVVVCVLSICTPC